MSLSLLGIGVIVLIFGVVGAALYSAYSGSVSILRVVGVGGASGLVGSITTIFSDAWQFVVASAYGQLGIYGYFFIGGLILCLFIWGYNAYTDARKNRPIAMVK